jgi:uncharacterized protein
MLRRRLALLVAASFLLAFAWDVSRAPADQWTAAGAISAIRLYQRALAPLLGASGVRCRFTPSCSRYAEAALRKHGFLGGGWRAAKRLARCGPWTRMGTVDLPD